MNYWAVNGRNIDSATKFLTIEQQARPSLSDGDRIVIFERQQNGTAFVADAELSSTTAAPSPQHYELTSTLTNYNLLQPARQLNHFVYSLQKISNFATPSLHFRRQYTSLLAEDFATIVEGRVFWSRTAFGSYLNEMSESAMAAFVEGIGSTNPRLLIGPARFSELWKVLQNFIEGECLGSFRLLDAISTISSRLQLSDGTLSFDLLEVDDDNGNVDRLARQHRLLKAFVDTLQRPNVSLSLFEEINGRIASNDADETTFEVLFEGTTWPTRMTFR